MRIGVPKEIKVHEYRTGLAPESVREDAHLRNGLNVFAGAITQPAVAAALGYSWLDPMEAFSA